MKITKSYPWIVVALLWVVALLNYMDRQMLSTMQEAMKADIAELNRAEAFGALMAVFLWIYGIVSPFAGIIADRVSRKWLVIGSLFVWSAVTFLMGYAYILRDFFWVSVSANFTGFGLLWASVKHCIYRLPCRSLPIGTKANHGRWQWESI